MWNLRTGTALLWALWCGHSHGMPLPEQSIPSRHLGGARTVRVHLPPSYEREPRRRYPVLYLHDGQNVFSPAGTDCCFGWGSWELDKTADALVAEGRMREVILVAVDNSRSRYREYRGRIGSAGAAENARYDAYAAFLVRELKPWVDGRYRTLKTAANTGLMGSSMGGVASLALAWEHPRTFGAAASLSGAFQIEKRDFLENILRPFKGRRKPVRLYLDSGTVDYTGDDDGRKFTDAVAAELRRIGWKDGATLLHYTELHPLSEPEMARAGLRQDKWDEARRSQHNEFYWRVRAWRALTFLFPPQ